MKLTTELQPTGGNTTGFHIPDDAVEALGGGRRPAVTVSVNGYSWRTSIAAMGGRFWLGVSAANRAAAGLTAGDTVDLEFHLDDAPRTVDVPADLAAALAENPDAAATFAGLAFSHRRRHVDAINDAKTPDTRARRVAKAVEALAAARK